MPKKVRELKQAVRKAGFELLSGRGKGSHTMWRHPLLAGDPLVIPGKDGDDAPRWLEKEVEQKLRLLKELEGEE
jgi:predicted RNA binding protein YcfA (HicA-like mRNA interferase family)